MPHFVYPRSAGLVKLFKQFKSGKETYMNEKIKCRTCLMLKGPIILIFTRCKISLWCTQSVYVKLYIPRLVQACYLYRKRTVSKSVIWLYCTIMSRLWITQTGSAVSCYHKLYKSHSWLWAQQTQAMDSHCFHMQLLINAFLFTIIHEDRTSENKRRQW